MPVLVYDGGGDSRAARLLWILELFGIASVAMINGGVAAWIAADGLRHADVAPEHEIIFYCQAGYTACVGYLAARLMGFPRVCVYDGSLLEWHARGGPLVSPTSPTTHR